MPAVAKAEVERAIAKWSPPIIVGSILSSETREFLRPALAAGVVVIANGSSDPTIRSMEFRHARDGFFRNWPADDAEGSAMAEYVRQSGRAKKLAVFCAADDYARALTKSFITQFQALHGEVLGPEEYPASATSFEATLRRLPSEGIDGYYVVGMPSDLAGIYNTIRRGPAGQTVPIFTAVAAETSQFQALVKTKLDHLFFTSPQVDQGTADYANFRRAYKEKFNGDEPDIVASITYDALRLAAKAAQENRCQRKDIRDYLYRMPPFPGVTGATGFNELGDVVTKKVAIRYYDQGQLTLVGEYGGR